MYVTTFLVLAMLAKCQPITQLVACVPSGVIAGIGFICISKPQRKVAVDVIATVKELKQNR